MSGAGRSFIWKRSSGNGLYKRAAAGGARTGRAAEAVVVHGDRAAFEALQDRDPIGKAASRFSTAYRAAG